jgi:plasmid stability protein
MTIQSVTLNLPDALYNRLKRRAEQTHRTVETELLEVVASAVPVADELPTDLNEAISPLALLDDEALWRAARNHLPEEDNLWLACSLCNDHKGDRIVALDPLTGEIVRLFDPRYQAWREHFGWTETGDRIVGLTPTGRATVVALNLNRPSLVKAREAWVTVGWHLPKD